MTVINYTNTTPLGAAVNLLQGVGFIDVVLPFLLVFAIAYGALSKTKVLGEKEAPNVVVAFVMALAVTVTAVTVGVIKMFLPLFGLFMIFVVAFLVLMSLFFGDIGELAKNKYIKVLGGVVIVTVLLILGIMAMGGALNLPTSPSGDANLKMIFDFVFQIAVLVAFILMIVGIVYIMSKQEAK